MTATTKTDSTTYLDLSFDDLIAINACGGAKSIWLDAFGADGSVEMNPANLGKLIDAEMDIAFFFDEVFKDHESTRLAICWKIAYACLGDLIKLARLHDDFDRLQLRALGDYARILRRDANAAMAMREANTLNQVFTDKHSHWYDTTDNAAHWVFQSLWSLELAVTNVSHREDGGACLDEVLKACRQMINLQQAHILETDPLNTEGAAVTAIIPRTLGALAWCGKAYQDTFAGGLDRASERHSPYRDDDDEIETDDDDDDDVCEECGLADGYHNQGCSMGGE